MAKLTAAVVQAGTVGADVEATLQKAETLIAECGSRGAAIAVFPEAFIGGYPKGANFHIFIGGRTPEGRDEFAAYWSRAIAAPGPETARLGTAARHAKTFVPSASSSAMAERCIARPCSLGPMETCLASIAKPCRRLPKGCAGVSVTGQR